MTSKIVAGAAALLLLTTGARAAEQLVIYNQSDVDVHHLYLSSTAEKNWGPDQLGDDADDVISPGEKFTLVGISPDDYDVKVVSNEGDVCEIDDVDFTISYQLVITNDILDHCD